MTGKAPIGCKWVDVNKGDEQNPEYRSRLVATEVKKDKREDLFAATPPLEGLRFLLSLAMTAGYGDKMKISFIDVRRAHFHSVCKRDVFVELPPEDKEEGMVGKLQKSMYGTRDAALNWEE